MKQASQWNCGETEIDLYQCIKVLLKRKMTFIVVFLFFFAVGLGCSLASPKIYRISALLQSSVSGEKTLPRPEDLESAESLKALIINGAFDEALSKRLNLDPDKNRLKFDVVIPDKSNILQISIDLERSKKEFGVAVLRNLVDLMSEKYAKQASLKSYDDVNQIKFNENHIKSAKKEADNLQKQIKEVTDQESKLRKEIKALNVKIAQPTILSDNNLVQNELQQSDRLNGQLSKLSICKDKLNLEIRTIDYQISDFQMKIERLKSSINSIPKLEILSQPRVSSRPIRINQVKILALMINMGIFFGILAVFLQEFWSTKRKKL